MESRGRYAWVRTSRRARSSPTATRSCVELSAGTASAGGWGWDRTRGAAWGGQGSPAHPTCHLADGAVAQRVALEAGAAERSRRVPAQLAAGAVLQGALVYICSDSSCWEPTARLPGSLQAAPPAPGHKGPPRQPPDPKPIGDSRDTTCTQPSGGQVGDVGRSRAEVGAPAQTLAPAKPKCAHPNPSLPAQLCPSLCSTQPAPQEHCTPQWVSAHVSAQPPLRTKQLRPAGRQWRGEIIRGCFCSSPGPTPAHRTCWAHRCRPGSHPHRCTSGTPGCTSPRRTSPCRPGRGLRHTQLVSGGHGRCCGSLTCGEVPQSVCRFPPSQGELGSRTAKKNFTRTTPGRSQPTKEHLVCPLTTDVFVRGIAAVVDPVALPLGRDAHPVPALPLPGQAGLQGTALLVPAVLAVLVPVAQLPVRDAVVGAGTLQLLRPTHCGDGATLTPHPAPHKIPSRPLSALWGPPTAVLLVGAIRAVGSSVAPPAAGNAAAIVTLPRVGVPATGSICGDSTRSVGTAHGQWDLPQLWEQPLWSPLP